MNNKFSAWLIIVSILALIFLYIGASYNNLVSKNEQVESAWGQVSNVYQRRLDLIPNLVETVKAYAKHEESTLVEVVEARANASKTVISGAQLNKDNLAEFEKAQSQVSNSLSRLLVSVEQYPNLKANENFIALQTQLEGTENRIANERRVFNEVVQSYNTSIKTFPNNILAKLFGFDSKIYFEASKQAQQAPQVKF